MPIVLVSRFFLAHFFLIIYLLKELFLRVCFQCILILIGSPTFHISYELLMRFTAVISKCGRLTNISIPWGFVGDAKSYPSRQTGYQRHHLGEA